MINIDTTMEKIARIYSKNTGVSIVPGAGFSTDCRKMITIPPISDQADPWIRFMTEVGVYHEIGHIKATDPDKNIKDPTLFRIANSLEDIRIEAVMQKEWPGMVDKWKKFLTTFIKDTMNARMADTNETVIKKMLDITYIRGNERRLGDLGLKLPKDVEDLWQKKVSDLMDRIATADTQDKVNELATELLKRFKDVKKDPPQQKNPNQKNQEKQNGKGTEQTEQADNQDGDTDSEPSESPESSGEGTAGGDTGDDEESNGDPKNSSGESEESDEGSDQDGSGEEDGSEDPEDDSSEPEKSGNGSSSEEEADGSDAAPADGGSEKKNPLEKQLSKEAKDGDTKIDSIGDEIAKTVNNYADTNQIYRVDPSVRDIVFRLPERNGWREEIARYETNGKRMTAYVGNKFRSLFISEQARVWMRNLRSGRLDTKKLWNDDSESIFRKKTEGRREDAVVSLIIDNSGSMHSNGTDKYLIASSLLVSLANELDRVRVPFECVGFTSGSNDDHNKNPLGIRTAPIHLNVIKMFNEPYRRSKHRFVWPPYNSMTVELDCLKYAVNRLIQRKETKKVIFVLCDGRIDSSSSVLNGSLERAQKEYIARLEKAGIFVVGFGIEDNSVAQYYTNHILINDMDEFARKFFKELSHILIGR